MIFLAGVTASVSSVAVSSSEDASCLSSGVVYSWREWALCRGRDALYLWSDVAALELSTGSNGWFRYLLDGKLATMYSSGSPEHQTDNTGTSHMNGSTYCANAGLLLQDAVHPRHRSSAERSRKNQQQIEIHFKLKKH